MEGTSSLHSQARGQKEEARGAMARRAAATRLVMAAEPSLKYQDITIQLLGKDSLERCFYVTTIIMVEVK